ncbi:alpha/beta hydrolase [Roseomonas sp. KE0001]|uniref:alpha/beta hydrolase n=1 Tax=Roseomonas sp. KE0001 TaxID=2479201 RepID=UPI0018DF5476|nr:dienelactone hydrolase family protein [Roseomonas sp. KE0001]MBI0434560.1 phospholipase [Roseomonas sp. KE0001]
MSGGTGLLAGGTGPHANRPVALAGAPLASAAAALILVHGRGGGPEDMLALGRELAPPGMALLAPEAAGHSWYPHRFIEPTARNEPWLSSALSVLADVLPRTGLPPEKVAVLGFSQGACLALEFLARRRAPLGAAIGFSGGLIGDRLGPVPSEEVLAGMPVLLGCSRLDPHIPERRVLETEAHLRGLGAAVTTRLYPGGFHGVNQEEAALARTLLATLTAG